MNTTETHPGSQRSTTSRALLITIIAVLFVVFFSTEHDIFYTINRGDFRFSEEETSSISHGGSATKQITFLLLFFFSIFILINRHNILRLFRDPIGVLIFTNLLWATLSVFWADISSISGRRLVLFLILNVAAFSVAINVSLRKFPIVVMWLTTPIIVIGFVAERTLGTWWYGSSIYRFSGTHHPEGQAMHCSMLFLAAAAMVGRGGRFSRLVYLGLMVCSAFFLTLTKSRGPFVGTLIAFGILVICTKKRPTVVAYSYLFIVVLSIIVLVLGDAIVPFFVSGVNLGREESLFGLSGRADLWNELTEFARERPLIGYGYRGFWTEERVLTISDAQRWRIRSGHSIYVDTVLNLGFVGLGILLSLFTLAFLRGWRLCLNGGYEGVAFGLSLLVLFMADGIFASLVLGGGFVTFSLLFVLYGIARESEAERTGSVAA